MAGLAGISMLFPHAGLDWIWNFKRDEYRQLLALRWLAGPGFIALASVLAVASYGCFWRKRWGWALARVIIAMNAVGDAARMISGGAVEGAIGVLVAGTILWWLSRRPVRAAFR